MFLIWVQGILKGNGFQSILLHFVYLHSASQVSSSGEMESKTLCFKEFENIKHKYIIPDPNMNAWACCMCIKDLEYWEEMANLHIHYRSRKNIYNTVPHELPVSIRSVCWVAPSFCSRCKGESGRHQQQHGPLIQLRAGMSKILDPVEEDWNADHSRIQLQQKACTLIRNTRVQKKSEVEDNAKLLLMQKYFL